MTLLRQSWPEIACGLALLLLMAALPQVLPGRYWINLLTLCLIYAIWATSWTFMSGLTGRENFGHSLFIGIGAYAAAFLSTGGAPLWTTLPAALVLAGLAGALIGLPTLRLTGPYFALATLAAATIAERLFIVLGSVTGGEDGVFGIPRLAGSREGFYYLTLAVTAAVIAALWVLARGRWGRVLRAIGSDEAAVMAAGINATAYKVGAFVISAAAGGIGGALYAHQQLYVNPHIFAVMVSVTVLIIAYVGGLGSIGGAAVAAILLTALTDLLRDAGAYRLLVYTGILIALLFLAPGGVLAPLWARMRRAFR
jgi:branched-chain amino acid transport system permease protein